MRLQVSLQVWCRVRLPVTRRDVFAMGKQGCNEATSLDASEAAALDASEDASEAAKLAAVEAANEDAGSTPQDVR